MLPDRPEVVESYFQGIFENVYFLQEGGGYYLTSQAESGDGDCSALLTTTEFLNANENFIRLVVVRVFGLHPESVINLLFDLTGRLRMATGGLRTRHLPAERL